MSGGLGGLMGKAMRFVGPHAGMDMAKGLFDTNQGPTTPPSVGYQPGGVLAANEESLGSPIHGEDSMPEHATEGFRRQHSGAPEELDDTADGGNSKDQGPDENDPKGDFDLGELATQLSEVQLGALEQVHQHLPLIVMYAENDEMDGSTNPILRQLDEALEGAFPGYRAEHSGDADKPDHDHKESSVDPIEKIAARRPKMCPAHNDLVDASLISGSSLLGQFAPSNYGANYCKDSGFEGKCNFKPQMTTQKYWDDKDAEYAERAQQRAEQAEAEAAQAQVDEFAGTTLDPTEHDVDFGNPVTEPAGEYAPGLSEAPSAVGVGTGEFQMAAAAGWGPDEAFDDMTPHIKDWHADLAHLSPGTPVRWKFYDRGTGYVQEEAEGNRPGLAASVVVMWPDGKREKAYTDHLVPQPREDAAEHPGTGIEMQQGGAPFMDSPHAMDSESQMYDMAMHAKVAADQFDFHVPEHHGDEAHSQEDSAVGQDPDESGVEHDSDDNAHVRDTAGSPLREGATYLMKSAEYTVPDRVTIDKIAGDSVTYTLHASGMDMQDHMKLADIESEGFEFEPAHSASPEENDLASKVPAPTDTHHQEADDLGRVEDVRHANLENLGENAAKPFGSKDDDDDEEPKAEEDEKSEADKPEAVEKEASVRIASVPDEHMPWHAPAGQVTAGADFSPMEQRQFINEEGEARNLDRLDLKGTHYPQGSSMDDQFLW